MRKPGRLILNAVLGAAAIALNGCATHHVGDDWQCPLIRGIPCQRVAEADPAGPGGRQSPGGQQSAGARQNAGGTRIAAEQQSVGAQRVGRARQVAGLSWRRSARPKGAPQRGDMAHDAALYGLAVALAPESDDAEPPAAQSGDSQSLRTPEVIGRIWIAPYVDGDGVYREAAWVRVVLEQAGWRRP